ALAAGVGASRPRDRSGAHLAKPHGDPDQRGLARAVRPDQHGGRPGRKHERDSVEKRDLAGTHAHVFHHHAQIPDPPPHPYPARTSPTRRTLQASALTRMMITISTKPSPMASARSPFDVSSAIAVVMVRVKPSILPPTIISVPTSAAARPKPASRVVTRLKRASHSNAATRPAGPTRIAVISSRYSTHRSSTVWRVNAAMIGMTSTA